MRKTLTFLLIIAALAVALATALRSLSEAKDDALRTRASLRSAMGLVRRYVSRDSLNAACRTAQYRTIGELRNERADLVAQIKNLRVRLRDAESVTQMDVRTEYAVRLDTVRVMIHDTARPALAYSDKWLTARLVGDSLAVTTRDSLTVLLHSRRRRFLFWTWRRYSGAATVVCKNPHSEILGVETVVIEK